jgi:hypothetical protein
VEKRKKDYVLVIVQAYPQADAMDMMQRIAPMHGSYYTWRGDLGSSSEVHLFCGKWDNSSFPSLAEARSEP